MTSNRIAFSDSEILFYGNDRGFMLNPSLSILCNDLSSDRPDGLLSETLNNPGLKLVADYVAGSFMNPKNVLKIFACVEDYFLRLRLALPHANTSDPEYAIVYEAGDIGGYLTCENRKTICKIFQELSGINSSKEMSPIGMEISPIYLLIILAACDVILQNKYDGGWFTAASVFNSYDNSGESGLSRLVFPLAYVADDVIYNSISFEDIQKVLNEMVNEEILNVDEIDDTSLYSFALEYKYLPKLFDNLRNCLAVYKHDEAGNIFILYVISNQTETWGFTIKKDTGKIERLNEEKLMKLYETVLAAEDTNLIEQTQMTNRFCMNCGSLLNEEAKFCSNCGRPV